MTVQQILSASFMVIILTSGIRLATPILMAVLGEIITEKGGVLNLGLEGIMLMGATAGFIVTFYLQNTPLLAGAPAVAGMLGLLGGALAGTLMGLIMALLTITLQADQVVSSVMLVLLGSGFSTYIYRQLFRTSHPQVPGFVPVHLPLLSNIPVLGPVLFKQDVVFYLTSAIVVAVWFFLYRTTMGLNIRAAGENPSAVETSGLSVKRVRYTATLLGAALVGLGGAILTVAQLRIFTQNVTSGRGWIAVALVIFSRWKPSLAVAGALLFGIADAIQYNIQALGRQDIPYELLLMLPYVLTIVVLLRGIKKTERPAALGQPYTRTAR
jgi:ABC-type uncharacterized transport system permease subunit